MSDQRFLRLALRLAKRGLGATSPNPAVGAVLVKAEKVIGQGWHRRAGFPHAEIEALRDSRKRGHNPQGATLYVTLEPCCTHGRTPPCTDAIIAAGIKRVLVGATDPNPKHAGKGFTILKRSGIDVVSGILADECTALNESFNHWIVHRTPFVTVKAAMTLDGKIATASGESKWITGEPARVHGMNLRRTSDAILVGINTILADDPSLTYRTSAKAKSPKLLRRIVLDSMARTPLSARIVSDEKARATTIVVVSPKAHRNRVAALARKVEVVTAPWVYSKVNVQSSKLNLTWLMKELGRRNITSLLVEGGGEVNASFLFGGLAHRVEFFYASKILGGRGSRKGVAGEGINRLSDAIQLVDVEWKQIGADLLLSAKVIR